MGKLVVNEEGFIDMRSNPPATRVQVQGGIKPPEPVKDVPVVFEPPPAPKDEPLPAIQKTAEGLVQSAAPPVAVPVNKAPVELKRIDSVDGPPCYAVMGPKQYERLSRYQWHGVRTGHLFRRVKSATGVETIIWLHREARRVNRADQFIAFLDGDERNLTWKNLLVCHTAEEARQVTRQALQSRAGRST